MFPFFGDTTEANHLFALQSTEAESSGGRTWRLVQKGAIYEEANYLDQAEELFRKAHETNVHNLYVSFNLARFLIVHEFNMDEGTELMEELIDLRPKNWNYLYYMGMGLYKQGRVKEAGKYLHLSWDLRLNGYDHEHFLLLQEVDSVSGS